MKNQKSAWRKYGRHFLGILLLMGVVTLWVGANFIMSYIFKDMSYNKPFLTTYLNTASFSFYLIFDGGKALLSRVFRLFGWSAGVGSSSTTKSDHFDTTDGDNVEMSETPVSSVHDLTISNDNGSDRGSERAESVTRSSSEDSPKKSPLPPLTLRETLFLSAQFCLLWFLANICNNASLAFTDVASSTIIASTSSLWTLIIGVVIGCEKFSFSKVLSVFASIGGVTLVSLSPSAHSQQNSEWHNQLIGDLLALFGAFFYGAYSTLLQRKIGDESRVKMTLFFGFVGLINIFTLWPTFFLLDWTGWEKFELPSWEVGKYLMINSFLGTFMSEYFWLMAMLLTTPLTATMGLSLTIPCTVLIESFYLGATYSANFFVGASLVLVGFIVVNLSGLYSWWDRKVEEKIRKVLSHLLKWK